jgi:hypothetical protein
MTEGQKPLPITLSEYFFSCAYLIKFVGVWRGDPGLPHTSACCRDHHMQDHEDKDDDVSNKDVASSTNTYRWT